MEKLSNDLFKKMKKDEMSKIRGGDVPYEPSYHIVWSNDIEKPPCGGPDKRYDTACSE